MADKPGDSAVAVAKQQLNKPYVYTAAGPDSFDCSGLIYYSYLHGPGIDVTRSTDSMWSNNTTLTTIYDARAGTGSIRHYVDGQPKPDASKMEVGDILLFGQPGATGPRAHAQMYYGGGQVIEATGDHVQINTMNLTQASPTDPLQGIKRTSGSGGGGGAGGGSGNGGGNSGQGSGNQDTTGKYWQDQSASIGPQIADLKDPRNNLPFSAYFRGQQIIDGVTKRLAIPGQAVLATPTLVRGGMAELAAKQFMCYFMMNPTQISASVGINTSALSPLQQSPDLAQSGGYWVSNQTISFTIYFNRMYEVWQGNVPGPSDVGCRWDIRALERLVGIFDAVADNGGAIGTGNYGWGQSPAMTIPLQVVFGGANSMQFQGIIASLDYTFTLFDANMIPIEAFADVSVMRLYQPAQSSAPLVQALIDQTGQIVTPANESALKAPGTVFTTFNNVPGTIFTGFGSS